jgi:hypothetical protein
VAWVAFRVARLISVRRLILALPYADYAEKTRERAEHDRTVLETSSGQGKSERCTVTCDDTDLRSTGV